MRNKHTDNEMNIPDENSQVDKWSEQEYHKSDSDEERSRASESSEDEDLTWRRIVQDTFIRIKEESPNIIEGVKNPKELLKDPVLTKIVEEIEETVRRLIKDAQIIENSALYKEIMEKMDYFQTKYRNIDDGEAEKKAWNKKKYDIRALIVENRDLMDDLLNDSSDEESNDNDENEDEEGDEGKENDEDVEEDNANNNVEYMYK